MKSMACLIVKLMRHLLVHKNIFIVALVYTALVTIALLSPSGNLPPSGIAHIDKVVHFVINAGLVFLWLLYAFLLQRDRLKKVLITTIILACFVYGILIEVTQEIFTVSRQADVMDVLANFGGLITGILAFTYLKRKI